MNAEGAPFWKLPMKEQERQIGNQIIDIKDWFGGWDELAEYIEEQRNSD